MGGEVEGQVVVWVVIIAVALLIAAAVKWGLEGRDE